MFSRSTVRFALPLTLLLAAPALGCGGTTSSQALSVPGAVRAPVAQTAHDQVKLIGEALGDVPLTPEQRGDIERLAADADVRHESARTARRELMLSIAAQVEAGAIDRAALQPKVDALALAAGSAQPADRVAFERLHAILAPDQRTAFVDALEARLSEHAGELRERHPMRAWAADLKLSDAQQSQIKALLEQSFHAKREGHDGGPWSGEGRHRGAKLLGAFKQDRFVMDDVAPAVDVGRRASTASDRFLGIASQVLPVLTPGQRSIAAQKIRDRAASGFEADRIP
jgi:Spy/CpxP family protein refolding chaperone